MSKVIVFDVNETLLDVSALEPDFHRVFRDGRVAREWFTQLLQYSMASTLAGTYFDFTTIAGAVLEMTAASRGMPLSNRDKHQIIKGLLSLPPYPDVTQSLERLKHAGFRLATLTNSAQQAVCQQIENAGLSAYFESNLSVDAVRRYKPAPEVYRMAAEKLAVSTGELRLVAPHAWDEMGAMQAGCTAAFVARLGKVFYPLAPEPDIVGPDLRCVADEILKKEHDRS